MYTVECTGKREHTINVMDGQKRKRARVGKKFVEIASVSSM